jgi:histone-lysine N-methyltransferase SETMAR
MGDQKLHFRHCMLYEFDLKHNAAEAAHNICFAYGKGALTDRTCRFWFAKFRKKQRDLSDEPHTGRPIELDEEALRAVIEDDPRQSTRELATKFNCSNFTIDLHLHAIGKTNKHGVWVPHELTPQCKFQRSAICASLLSRQDSEPFLDRIVTGDEKWVLYVNQENKNQWLSPGQKPKPVPKLELHPEKVLLSIWWNLKGIVYWELLESGATVTAEVYCEQLQRVQEALIKKHPALVNRKKNCAPS